MRVLFAIYPSKKAWNTSIVALLSRDYGNAMRMVANGTQMGTIWVPFCN